MKELVAVFDFIRAFDFLLIKSLSVNEQPITMNITVKINTDVNPCLNTNLLSMYSLLNSELAKYLHLYPLRSWKLA